MSLQETNKEWYQRHATSEALKAASAILAGNELLADTHKQNAINYESAANKLAE